MNASGPNTPTPPRRTQWQLYALDHTLGPHRPTWDALNFRLTQGHPMLDGAFVEALLKNFAHAGVRLAVATQAGETVGMALMQPHVSGLGVWSSFLPSQAQMGPTLLPIDIDLGALFPALRTRALELDLLCNDPKFGDLRQLKNEGMQSLPHALTMSVSLTGSFDDYWALRPRKLVQNMRRYSRRLQAEAEASRMVINQSPEDLAAAVARYASLEAKGWKGREGTAVTLDSTQGRFYAEVMQHFGKAGEARVYELWLGDALLASRMLLIREGMAVMLKTAFDEAFERFAPGRVLLMRTLEDLFHCMPGGSVEFYTDAESDLLAWATSQRWINHVSLYRHPGLQTLYTVLRSGRRWLKRERAPSSAQVLAQRSGATVDVYRHPRELPADACALMSARELDYVEFGADWFTLIANTVFLSGANIRIYVLQRRGRTLAVLPTVHVQGSAETLALGNYYTTLFAPSFDDDLAEEDLLPLTLELRRQGGTGIYRFAPMDPSAKTFHLLQAALQRAGLVTQSYFAFGNWYETVHQSWPDYLKSRDGQVRSTIKRMGKKFANESGRLEIIKGGDSLETGIAAYQAVYAKSWKIAEPYPEFIPELIRLCARRGWLRLGVAWLGDRPVAAQLWMVYNGRANIYKLAYDEDFKSYAPGTLLTALLMEHVLDVEKVREIDYLVGDDAYKATWMTHRRERFGLVAYDPMKPMGLVGLARQTLGKSRRILRSILNNRINSRKTPATMKPPQSH